MTSPHLPGPRARRLPAALLPAVVVAAVSALLATGCAAPAAEPQPGSTPAATPPGSAEPAASASPVRETSAASPRLVLTYDGGLTVLDAATLDPVAELALPGFLRLSEAGDGRHLAVSGEGGFRLLDVGAWSKMHGDHGHHYVTEPRLADRRIDAGEPGHVVAHGGRTAFFDDADGSITLLKTDRLAQAGDDGEEHMLPAAHHGIAVPLEGGGMAVSLGDEQGRLGAAVLDADGHELMRSEDCEGLHGEAAAQGAVVFGCQDGMLIFRDGEFSKVRSPDSYGRMGNQAGSASSPVVLADYKADPAAELERPERIALVDTAAAAVRLVDLGTSYSFRSLGRAPGGEALVLGTDGALHMLNPATGEATARIPVVEAWEEPADWQQPRPALHVLGGTAYVTDPAAQRLHAVDLASGAVVRSADLAHVPNEISGVRG